MEVIIPKFQVRDKVIRVGESQDSVVRGLHYTVKEVFDDGKISLENTSGKYSEKGFKHFINQVAEGEMEYHYRLDVINIPVDIEVLCIVRTMDGDKHTIASLTEGQKFINQSKDIVSGRVVAWAELPKLNIEAQ